MVDFGIPLCYYDKADSQDTLVGRASKQQKQKSLKNFKKVVDNGLNL